MLMGNGTPRNLSNCNDDQHKCVLLQKLNLPIPNLTLNRVQLCPLNAFRLFCARILCPRANIMA